MTTVTAPLPTRKAHEDSIWNSRVVKSFRRNPLAIMGLVVCVVFIMVAIFAPLLAPPKANCLRDLGGGRTSDVYNLFGGMFWKATFAAPPTCYEVFRPDTDLGIPSPPGTKINFDGQEYTMILGKIAGYDLWYALIWGTRTAFRFAIIITLITAVVGVVLGAVAGYYGGWFDNLMMRIIDVVFALPNLITTVVLIGLMGANITTIIIASTITGWSGYSRLIRGDILKVRQLEYVDGARALGASDARVIFKHVIPNALTTLFVVIVLDLGAIPVGIAALSFLGLGLPVGYADWGQAVSFARNWIQGPPGNPFAYWYVIFFPALTIILWGLGWNLLGDALRDALDPREK